MPACRRMPFFPAWVHALTGAIAFFVACPWALTMPGEVLIWNNGREQCPIDMWTHFASTLLASKRPSEQVYPWAWCGNYRECLFEDRKQPQPGTVARIQSALWWQDTWLKVRQREAAHFMLLQRKLVGSALKPYLRCAVARLAAGRALTRVPC